MRRGRPVWRQPLFVLALLAVIVPCSSIGRVRLKETNYVVQEGNMLMIEILKTGIAATDIQVAVEITNANEFGGEDFVNFNAAGIIPSGSRPSSVNVTFTVWNDTIPENDEIFTFQLRITNGDGELARDTPSVGTVTIAANDDAFGRFSFTNIDLLGNPIPVVVREPRPDASLSPNIAVFTIQRVGGIFGLITLNFEVQGLSMGADPQTDVNVTVGQVTFEDKQTSGTLELQVMPDDIPENDEDFRIQITLADGGVSIDQTARTATIERGQARLMIPANDAPISFSEAMYETVEGGQVLTLRIYRGLDMSSMRVVGPTTGSAMVSYFFVPVTAQNAIDFRAQNGTLIFGPDFTQQTITLQIIPDNLPENDETFVVQLANPIGDVVLTEPANTTVVIQANDNPNGILMIKGNQAPFVFYLDEDGNNTGIVIYRHRGTFGEVSIDWEIIRDDDLSLVTDDINPSTGKVIFRDGENEAVVELQPKQDLKMEPSERFRFFLLPRTAQGGAIVANVTSADVILKDSGDFYGVLSLQGDIQVSDSAIPLHITETLVRTGGSTGRVRVTYTVEYVYGNTVMSDIFTTPMPITVTLAEREFRRTLSVTVQSDAFLQFGATFQTRLLQAELVSANGVTGYNSPRIGQSDMSRVNISAAAANGVISFEDTSTQVVAEPDGEVLTRKITLRLKREGTNGVATIFWEAKGSGPTPDVITDDVKPTSGMVRMLSGIATAAIEIDILADDIPEINEMFTVTLTKVEPGDRQRIQNSGNQVNIMIEENDTPGGIFEFAPTMNSTYVVSENDVAITVSVVRSGGAITTRFVKYFIEPNGDVEFYGGTAVIRFDPGERVKNSTIIAKPDGVPELDEHFRLMMVGFESDKAPGTVGTRRVINITVSANDDPFGVFQFDSSSRLQQIQETKGLDVYTATFTVVRSQGLYTEVSVRWNIVGKENNTDLRPLSGLLVFPSGEKNAFIILQSIADEFPEEDETFEMNLTDPSDGTKISSPSTARITITANDKRIYFKEPTVKVDEPGRVMLTVVRDSPTDDEVRVKYKTADNVALAIDHDYTAILETLIIFRAQETEYSFEVEVIDDTLPETDESFYVLLYDPQGDVSVFGGNRATVIIKANDNANGVFHFREPFNLSTMEGAPAEFIIRREVGIFSEVQVHWIVLDAATDLPVPNDTDFEYVTGNVSFADKQQEAALVITPATDNIPEYSEYFIIQLTNITGGGPSGEIGILANDNLQVRLEVLQNDDPSGVFILPPELTRDLVVAEDFYPDEQYQARADITIERRQGMVGEVMVAWELYSYQIAGAGDLPNPTDLLFLGTYPENVTMAPSMMRPRTGTMALYFSGCSVCYVQVAQEHQVAKETIEDGFTISAWIQPLSNTNGFILAKMSDNGARPYYALRITTSTRTTMLEFQYSIPANIRTQFVITTVLKNLQDDKWHHILLTIASSFAEFYVDGEKLAARRLRAETTVDGDGILLVGAVWPGDQFFTGYMQDVRMFSRKLDMSEIEELSKMPSSADLSPVSGYVTFPANVSQQNITLFTVDDNEEEANEAFAIRLIAAKGGARLSEKYSTAKLTILKSDNANGLFGFAGQCIMQRPGDEGTMWYCPIERQRGDTDTVIITWEIRSVGTPLLLAASHFVNATGEVVFIPGQRENVLGFQGIEDDKPEQQQEFQVVLAKAVSSDGLVGTTETSGASINPSARSTIIRTQDSDYPFGLLEFSTGPVPGPGDPYIVPASQRPVVRVKEEAGQIRLLVVRAQGLNGQVKVEWRTRDGTAVSLGKTPTDFMKSEGRMTFEDGQRYGLINVTVFDNQIPENLKTFDVELVNPTGGAAVGLGSRVTVAIQPSDQAFGKFQFHNDYLQVSTTENVAGEARLRVVREGGSLSLVTLHWAVVNDVDDDIIDTSGELVFRRSQTFADIIIQVNDDSIPELDEVFAVVLINASSGDLGSHNVCRLTVEANDDPYGVYVISQADRPIRTTEADQDVTMTVERKALSGMFGTVNVTWRTVLPNEMQPQFTRRERRAQLTDYEDSSGWVVFNKGDATMTFNVTIKDDLEPELEESLYVILVAAEIMEADQLRPVFDSPRLGDKDETYGQIRIGANDRPAGVLQLSAATVTVQEGAHSVVYVERSAGAFGRVTVRFDVIEGMATYNEDYSMTSTDVVLADGERRKRLPVEIINDERPEMDEYFTIKLLDSITGGAELGAIRETRVVIAPSDDPFGAFMFQDRDLRVEEPQDGSTSVELPVIRRGGTSGVVTVSWEATLGGQTPTRDLQPSSGTIYFAENVRRKDITINILSDSEPEGTESVVITLTDVNNGGRIEPNRNTLILTIMPNDNPHGTIEFNLTNFVLHEMETDMPPQNVPVSRVGGSYGRLRVYYNTRDIDVLTEAMKEGQTIFSYYKDPLPGKVVLPNVGTRYPIRNLPDPLTACATFCLMTEACMSFDYSAVSSQCSWYPVGDRNYVREQLGYVYYETHIDKKSMLFDQRASPGLDYGPVSAGTIILEDGAKEGLIPIVIRADNIPELEELFQIVLTRVELLGGPPANLRNLPELGNHLVRTVVIEKNDNANGVFRIFSKDPRAMTAGRVMLVEERDKYSVELVVERQGGTINEVSVMWNINVTSTNATRGIDFIADGATLTFGPGETQRTLTIGIEDDVIPEDDEWIVVELSDPRGGATIGTNSSVLVIITASDNVGGVLYFTQTSYIVKEGDVLNVKVERTEPALGVVRVVWVLEAVNSPRPALRFNMHSGVFTFGLDEYQKDVSLQVLKDDTPKINQEYSLKLINITTEGVRETGAAGVDPQKSVAIVTIEGGNEPHGVFSFADGSHRLKVPEAPDRPHLIIDRKFGAIGEVKVHYEVKAGTLQPETQNLRTAVAGLDFRPDISFVTIPNNTYSGEIELEIYNDGIPEVDEVFLVEILSLELTEPSTFQPKMANQRTTAEVIIEANDGTHGKVVFSFASRAIQIEEETRNITLAIQRELGTFGDVSVFCFPQSKANGAALGADFNFEPREITFAAGETFKYIVVSIYDDDEPEPKEEVEIILASPKGGLTIGDEHKALITIMASDRASGIVSFESSEVITLNEPTPLSSINSRAELGLTRAPGVYGIVNVPYKVTSVTGGENVTDLTPVTGFVTFRDREGAVTLEILAVADDIPEEAETFIVTLLAPDMASLGLITQRTLVVERNDAPYGLLQIYPVGSKNRSMTIEEGNRVLYFDILRSQGQQEEVSVDVVTQAITAHSQMGGDIHLATIQQLNVRSMKGWGSLEVGGATYLVMVNHQRVAPLTTQVGSSGEGNAIRLENITQSVLFRWQGTAVAIQSIETDGASSATSFNIEGSTYLFITNYGGASRHETHSRLYKAKPGGTLEVVQDLSTKGALDAVHFSHKDDHFLVVANHMDNSGVTNINSDVYQWDFRNLRFSPAPIQHLATRGATGVAVVTVADTLFLVVTNGFDASNQKYEINSLIYKLDDNNRFTIHQQIPTMGATDVDSFHIGSDSYIIIANGQDDTGRYHQRAGVYVWNRVTQLFALVQDLPVSRVQTVKAFKTSDGKVHLSIAMLKSNSLVYSWDDAVGQFNKSWAGRPLNALYPVTIDQRAGPLTLLAEARPYNVSGLSLVEIYQLAAVTTGDSDYIHRALTLTFKEGETFLRTSVAVLEDNVPENTESFALELMNPRGGAELGQNKEVVVIIQSNDDGHGVIEFAENSVERYEEEVPSRDNIIQLTVVRTRGTSGRVVIRWRAEGDHNGLFDLTPVEGQVEFADGQAVASITLTIRDDALPESDELTRISLQEVVEGGSTIVGRGARIGQRSVSLLTVLANDSPYGVVSWERTSYITTEPEGTDATSMIHIMRTQGSVGKIRVSYVTSRDGRLPAKQQAVSGQDFVAVQTSVDMDSGVTRVPVEITVLADENPEVAETFLVNITSVQLVSGATIIGAGASVRRPGRVTSITIAENDNAWGIIQFDVTRNVLGRIDTFEGIDSLDLRLVRTIGFFGDVEIAWQTSQREATTDDYRPSAGLVTFAEGQRVAVIKIEIVDDNIPEDLQTFDVRLIRVTSGGATLGADNSVLVGIIRNDSPNGIFSFVPTQKTVRESLTSDDPNGVVIFDVQRRGTDGVVNLEWRLSADAVEDFQLPLAGTLNFGPGEQYKKITLRTMPNDILEGEERYTLSLVSADNNGEISPSAGDATVIILADPGASGVISIATESRFVLMGEPSVDYDGLAQIILKRSMGNFGEVHVTWQIVRRDLDAFVQHQGDVSFADKQESAVITVQTKDDNTPEPRRTFILEMTSATGGATVNLNAQTADIMVVASDYPHGLFQFGTPQEVAVSEDALQVTVPVERGFGSVGQVRVEYTTTPGTAVSDETLSPDFHSSTGWLVFGNNQRRQTVSIDIVDDFFAEGPEYFFVNLTKLELQEPIHNNYTVVSGLQLDIPPEIGQLNFKKVIINKNDNAEGVVEFSPDAANFIVYEEEGLAQVPLIRGPGTFGELRLQYTVLNGTARSGADFLVPSGEVVLPSGVGKTSINVTIVDDTLREFAEQFEVRLTPGGLSGGALLGARTTAVVTIAKSDYPNGRFGFVGQTEITIPNPATQRSLVFTITRSNGLIGRQMVHWRIMGPNSANRILEETNDIATEGTAGREMTNGVLQWDPNQDGPQSFVLRIKPHAGWEIEKTFIVVIYDIQGFPADTGNGETSPTASNFTLKILKFGHPNGIIRFDGLAQQSRVFAEPIAGKRIVRFPLYRREGTIGQIMVNWKVQGNGTNNVTADLEEVSGTVIIKGDKRSGEVTLFLQSDGLPELNEVFTLHLVSVIGGGEIDTQFNTSTFTIRFNGFPHGRFALHPAAQRIIVDPSTAQRSIRLNITRQDGMVGTVRVSYFVVYDQARTAVSYVPSSGAVQFQDGSRFGIKQIDIDDSVSITHGSTFTATLTNATYIGVGVTMPPRLVAGRTVARIVVPDQAANSEVGFRHLILAVDEETNLVDVAIVRRGSYGSLQVDWLTGYQANEGPQGFAQGELSEQSGTASMSNGFNQTTFKVQLSPRQVPELFAIHLPRTPISQTIGGAALWLGHTTVRFEPYGVIRFASASRNVNIQEPDERQVEVTLHIERVYGSLGAIQIRYQTFDGTAGSGSDYDRIENGAVNMDALQIRSSIFIQIKADIIPEEDEYFYVNFTSVLLLPTGTEQNISPRLSKLHSSAKVTISRNNDPYGVVSVMANSGESDGKVSEPGFVELTILRTGGAFGSISIQLRTIGGGESWDSFVGVTPSRTNETISEVLGNRDISLQAIAGQDYQTVDKEVTMEEGQTEQAVRVFILDDRNPEDDEVFFVYLVSRTEGVRIAQPSIDNGRKGFASITIRRNDFWNGWIGFHRANSTLVIADEDSGQPARLTIERLNASFGALTVYWEARISRVNEQVKNDQLDLTAQLTTVKDDVECPPGQRFCVFDVILVNDQVPQNQTSFVVELTRVSAGAQIDPSRRFANVTLRPSDNPNGLVQFATSSRVIYVDKSAVVARLEVERVGYRNKRVMVKVVTQELPGPGPDIIAGLRVYHALDGADFNTYFSELTFVPGQRTQSVDIIMDRAKASDNPYPKLFHVTLTDVTNGAELGQHRANVTIVDTGDIALWDVWPQTEGDLTDATIDGIMGDLQAAIQQPLTSNQLIITENILDRVLKTAESKMLLQGTRASIMSVFCRLLDPDRDDATRGRWQLGRLLERFAYSYLVEYQCAACCTASALIYSPECPYMQFAVAKWYPEDINSYRYQARNQDHFILPQNLLRVQDHGRNSPNPECKGISFIEYASSHWFIRRSETLLNNRVLSVGVQNESPRLLSQPATYRIHTAERSIPAKRAQCVFFDEEIQQWTSRDDVCTVANNLALAIDNFVDCRCKHMSSYGVISQVKNPDLIGYPVWFHISCFICMIGVVLAILSHHLCITQAMFSANLLMHMCFAIFATELLYVIDAYLSPTHLLDILPTDNNYRCIVMSIFLHYFFLAQFTWMMTQAINFWKILVLNDEHTERKYVLYFLLGWGLPGLMVFLFCVLTYIVYRYATNLPPDRFYGDVNNSEDICFIVHGYAALAGVVVPALVSLMVVGIVFIQAFQLAPQWQAYDDIYRSRYNIHEIRTMLGFWGLLILTWLWGGLHMAYGQLWTLILFCIFNVGVGIYAMVVYAALRNPCLPCFRPQKATYAINYGPSEVGDLQYPPAVVPSVAGSAKGSRASLVNDAWEHESISPGNNNLRVKRSQLNGNVYVVPSPPYETKPPSHRTDDHDSQDFDELIFALKTGGGFTPSEMSHPPNPNEIPDPAEANYEMRRISIADTHL